MITVSGGRGSRTSWMRKRSVHSLLPQTKIRVVILVLIVTKGLSVSLSSGWIGRAAEPAWVVSGAVVGKAVGADPVTRWHHRQTVSHVLIGQLGPIEEASTDKVLNVHLASSITP